MRSTRHRPRSVAERVLGRENPTGTSELDHPVNGRSPRGPVWKVEDILALMEPGVTA